MIFFYRWDFRHRKPVFAKLRPDAPACRLINISNGLRLALYYLKIKVVEYFYDHTGSSINEITLIPEKHLGQKSGLTS
jgi:hypothetical protein